ncbi:family 2 glycosyl transferase, partial [Streptomyces sp. NPDC059627]
VRYVLVHKGAPRDISRVLDATPGLSRLSQQNGSALWRVDQQVSRATIVSANGSGTPASVPAGSVGIHTTVPAGADGRILRLADSASPGWTATLDGKPLTRTTVDGWAQGFELPSSGGTLDVTYDTPFTHTAWLWAQGALAVVLVVLALPGRRRDVDDDLPEEQPIPAQATEGEGRRARRLRAQAEAEEESQESQEYRDTPEDTDFPSAAPAEETQAAVPHQQPYDEWDPASYPAAADGYDTGYADQYQGAGTGQYQTGGYDQQTYDPYQTGQYDPYAYGGQQGQAAYDPTYQQGYDPAYDPAAQQHHGTGGEHPDGSQQ